MCDPMQSAVLDALSQMRSAEEAISTLIENRTIREGSFARTLMRRLDEQQMFEARDLEDLETFLRPYLARIEEGRQRCWVSDDSDTSHGWVQTFLTREAEDLQEVCTPLLFLRNALRSVQDMHRAQCVMLKLESTIV